MRSSAHGRPAEWPPGSGRRQAPVRHRSLALVLVLSLALPAWSQAAWQGLEGPGAPPPPPDDAQEAPPAPLETREPGYFDGCYGAGRSRGVPISLYAEVPLTGTGDGHATSAIPSLSSGSDDGKAWLVVAVLAAIALPFVVYAVDKPASPGGLRTFRCPSISLDLLGGAERGNGLPGGASGFVSTRLGFGLGHVGTDFEFDASSSAVSAFAAHLLLRPTPRAHVEGGLAVGCRRARLGTRLQEGLEVGLPHRYALWREGLRTLGLEVRPLLLVSTRVEPSLEAALLIPLADVLHLRVGGRVFTFQGSLVWGVAGGLTLALPD